MAAPRERRRRVRRQARRAAASARSTRQPDDRISESSARGEHRKPLRAGNRKSASATRRQVYYRRETPLMRVARAISGSARDPRLELLFFLQLRRDRLGFTARRELADAHAVNRRRAG